MFEIAGDCSTGFLVSSSKHSLAVTCYHVCTVFVINNCMHTLWDCILNMQVFESKAVRASTVCAFLYSLTVSMHTVPQPEDTINH